MDLQQSGRAESNWWLIKHYDVHVRTVFTAYTACIQFRASVLQRWDELEFLRTLLECEMNHEQWPLSDFEESFENKT